MTEPTDKERRKASHDALREAAAMLSAASGVKLAWGK